MGCVTYKIGDRIVVKQGESVSILSSPRGRDVIRQAFGGEEFWTAGGPGRGHWPYYDKDGNRVYISQHDANKLQR